MFANTDEGGQSRFLHHVFTTVPLRYDLINHLITWGMDIRWRRMAARECLAGKPQRVLDLCCGTGDLALTIARLGNENIEITGVDYSQPMLARAEQKAARLGGRRRLSFVGGDIASIPFPDDCFDSIGIAFAFRNLTYHNPLAGRYLAQVLRVLKKGGRFVIVESSQPHPRLGFIRWLHHLYVRHFVFRLGWLVSDNKESYRYLADSAADYYGAEELKELLMKAGFSRVSFRRLFFGAAAVHVAIK